MRSPMVMDMCTSSHTSCTPAMSSSSSLGYTSQRSSPLCWLRPLPPCRSVMPLP